MTPATVTRLRSPEATGKPLVRMDSAFYGYPSVPAAIRGGADVSVTARLDCDRGHAIIEQVHADLKDCALAHLPSGRFTGNAAWLVLAVMAFGLTRAAATLTGPALAKSRTATIRSTLISVPAPIASSARRLTLHLPWAWPWETAWNTLFRNLFRRH